MNEGRVLIIDDDASFRFAMGKALRRQGFEVVQAESGEAAVSMLSRPASADAALLDLRMHGLGGLEVLRRCPQAAASVIVLTGHGTVQAAVEAMKLGAFSFLEKPVDAEVLAPLLRQAIHERRNGGTGARTGLGAPPLVGESEPMREVRRFIERVAPTDETVAIYGETGTGKEVVARHLHLTSRRAQGPFVALNAASVQRDLFESELFGHRKGAFTGATSDRAGLFREAAGGTLFIDEVAELPLESQAKLLRALETRSIRPLGAEREVPVDVRFVAATNRNLWSEVEQGGFRRDLYFRLQVFPVVLPPLRDRLEDVPALADHLLQRIDAAGPTLSEGARQTLISYDWPGNVRELLNVLRRAVLFAEDATLGDELVRRMIAASVFGHAPEARAPGRASAEPDADKAAATNLADVERAHIAQVLEQMGGNVTRAATALGIDRRTLQRKLKSYDIRPDRTS